MTIIPTCEPATDHSLGGVFSNTLTRVTCRLGAEYGPFLVGGCVGELSAAQFGEGLVHGNSWRLTGGEAVRCLSERPADPFLCTHAFSATPRGPGSIAPRGAFASLFRPHFTLKSPGGPAVRSALGVHQPAYGEHRIRGVFTARGLRTLLDVRGLDGGGRGVRTPPLRPPTRTASQGQFDWGF